jgi:hypothetical protein
MGDIYIITPMFDCCSRKKPSKAPLVDQLRYTNPINMNLSDKIILTFNEEQKSWRSNSSIFVN